MKLRGLALMAAGIVLVAGVPWALGPPHAVWLNAGLRIDYPWHRSVAALAAAGGALTLAALLRVNFMRMLAALLGAAALILAAALLFYRVEALDAGLRGRGLLGTTDLPWTAVASVEQEPNALAVRDASGRLIRIDTGVLTPDQRASLERTISRRVREATQKKP
jgi:hypothetical protein